jgi:siroheme synthase (precorrin-2 oxidase/ferrochelatase)
VFVNAVDDPPNATAYLSGVVRRDGVTLAISTRGDAPALTALLREGLDRLLPRDLGVWMARARAERVVWRRDGVPMCERKPRLLRALNDLYGASAEFGDRAGEMNSAVSAPAPLGIDAKVPWLNSPENSWL